MEYRFSNRDLLKLILPLIAEQFLQIFVGLADSVMVASVGEAAVSAVSLVDTIVVLLINIFAALATGGAVIAGQFIGRKKEDQACLATGQLIQFVAIASVSIMVLGYLCRGFILHVVFGDIEADVMHNANLYLLIVFASIPFIALYNAGAAIFRTMGNSKMAMIMSLIMNSINLSGNAILIFGFHRGVEGVAIPTLVARIIACILILILLCDQNRRLHIPRPFSFKLRKDMLRQILYIGIPNSVENGMFQLGKILVLSLISGFGTASIAANAISNYVALFAVLPGIALGMATLTVISQCVGAGDYVQVRYYTKKLLKLCYLSLFIFNGLILLSIPFILKIYGLSQEASDLAYQIMVYHSICAMLIWPLSFTLPNTLRASNDVKITMLCAIISMWIFRVAFSYLLGSYFNLGIFGVWIAMTIDWFMRSVFFVLRYRTDKWYIQTKMISE